MVEQSAATTIMAIGVSALAEALLTKVHLRRMRLGKLNNLSPPA
jgi:hypothetical protein